MKYNITRNDGEPTSVTAFFGAETFIATPDHPNWPSIYDTLANNVPADDQTIKDLFDVSIPITKNFKKVSDRVSINAGRIFLDNEPVHNALTETIMRFYAEGDPDFGPLVAFMEKIETNPNQHSRDNLFRWLDHHSFGITTTGNIIAYKGVVKNSGDYLSVNSGGAIVNGLQVNGRVPNPIGATVEMPRSKVQHDPRVGCSTGLHVGTWRYAHDFAQGAVLAVEVNPRDVVSVPTDCGEQKMRVCRYTVLDVTSKSFDKLLFPSLKLQTLTQRAVERVVTKFGSGSKLEKPARKRTPKAPAKEPRYYEQFTKKHYADRSVSELRDVARIYEVKFPARATKDQMIAVLVKEGAKRRRTWK